MEWCFSRRADQSETQRSWGKYLGRRSLDHSGSARAFQQFTEEPFLCLSALCAFLRRYPHIKGECPGVIPSLQTWEGVQKWFLQQCGL
ncbi:hypothetical protein QQF64_026353 [Cirrhinus molitorella]|uniref:Uncharacterized protein n=1 Tax=Cirrhinus molitorella TaxID=172907 RepID=A0ABR3N9C4_9TELE